MISHAASASEVPEHLDALEYFGIETGKLTSKGMNEAYKIGMKRKQEYAFDKPLISKEKYKPEQIFMLSTKEAVTTSSAYEMLQGIYPLTDLSHPPEVNYLRDESYLWGTSFATILEGMIDTWTDDVQDCSDFPIYQVPQKLDNMMETRNCNNVHQYLEKDRFDDTLAIRNGLNETFGIDIVTQTEKEIEGHDDRENAPKNECLYNQLGGRVAQMYHIDETGEKFESFSK